MDNHQYLTLMGITEYTIRENKNKHKIPVNIKKNNWEDLRGEVSTCTQCALSQSRTQTVFGVGNEQADLLVIGEAPGFYEDKQGEPFVGRAGQLLDKILASIGLSRNEIYIANVLKCRPPENRDPLPEEIQKCTVF